MATAVRRAPARQLRTRTTLAPAPARARARAAAPARVTPAPRVRARARAPRRGLGIAAVATVAAVVLAVVFHVVLAQGQLGLDHTANEIAKAQQTYEKRRLAVARLSAPERIIGEAQRLGLVLPPDPPIYLTVPGAPVPASDATAPSTATSDWKVVKPHLGDTQP